MDQDQDLVPPIRTSVSGSVIIYKTGQILKSLNCFLFVTELFPVCPG